MSTDLMEAWSLEEGDQIVINDEVYKIVEIGLGMIDEHYRLYVVDEEGYSRTIETTGEKKFRLVLDNLAEV